MMSFSMRQWFRTYTTVGALLLVCMVFAFLSPQAFATVDNAINVSRQIAFLVLIAVGATFVMAAGEFDLSVGAMASFAGVMAAQLAVGGTDVVVSVALTLAMCVLMGMFNGWLVGYFGVLSFITTLATGTMLSASVTSYFGNWPIPSCTSAKPSGQILTGRRLTMPSRPTGLARDGLVVRVNRCVTDSSTPPLRIRCPQIPTTLSPSPLASISESDGPAGQRDANSPDPDRGCTARDASPSTIFVAELGLGSNHSNTFYGRSRRMV